MTDKSRWATNGLGELPDRFIDQAAGELQARQQYSCQQSVVQSLSAPEIEQWSTSIRAHKLVQRDI